MLISTPSKPPQSIEIHIKVRTPSKSHKKHQENYRMIHFCTKSKKKKHSNVVLLKFTCFMNLIGILKKFIIQRESKKIRRLFLRY